MGLSPVGLSSPGALGAKGTQEHPRQGTPKTKGMQGERHARHKAFQDTRHSKTEGTAKAQGWLLLPAGDPHGSPPLRRGAAEHLTMHWSRQGKPETLALREIS